MIEPKNILNYMKTLHRKWHFWILVGISFVTTGGVHLIIQTFQPDGTYLFPYLLGSVSGVILVYYLIYLIIVTIYYGIKKCLEL